MYEALHQVPRHQMSGLAHRHLLAVSSDDILEIHTIYDVFGPLLDREDLWSGIDNLTAQKFPSLSTLSEERKSGKNAPWVAFISQSEPTPSVPERNSAHNSTTTVLLSINDRW